MKQHSLILTTTHQTTRQIDIEIFFILLTKKEK